MFKLPLAILSIGTLAASGQSSAVAKLTASEIPGFDAARGVFSQTGETDLSGGPGTVEVTEFGLRSALSRPITLAEGVFVVPYFDYRLTSLNFDGTAAAFPMGDEDLHSLALSTFVVSMSDNSPWIYGAWMRAEMASDFQTITNDDFSFDLAGGVGYRWNDHFILAAGAAVTNLNGDPTFYPGISFDWIVNDQLRVGLYGPSLIAAYALSDDWLLSIRGDSGGGVWNITDAGGLSRSIDLSSYYLGLYASRRLTGQLWLTAGVGATVGNSIDYTTPGGRELLEQDIEEGLFGLISLRLKAW